MQKLKISTIFFIFIVLFIYIFSINVYAVNETNTKYDFSRIFRIKEDVKETKETPHTKEETDIIYNPLNGQKMESGIKIKKETSQVIEKNDFENKEYGSPENGEDYDFTNVKKITDIPKVYDRNDYIPKKDKKGRAVDTVNDLKINIKKQIEWINKDLGDANITLSYESNSGSISGTSDMNVVLIQDKSGSMDSNYGLHLELVRKNLNINNNEGIIYYPIRNSLGYSEDINDILNQEKDTYQRGLNFSENVGFSGGWYNNGEMSFNSPCAKINHYYLINSDVSSIGNKTFVHGNNLYNISGSDLHHYIKLSGRNEALSYLNNGRRIVRSSHYINESGIMEYAGSEPYYFLDVSTLITFNGKRYLQTCTTECEQNDRLSKSIDFMSNLITDIKALNHNNKIAYVPFWADVPTNGYWTNYSSNGSTNDISPDPGGGITYKSDVTAIDFSTSDNFSTIVNQIKNPFTYNGTNYSRAFQKAIAFLNNRSETDKQKETLVLFLTDGVPGGWAGKSQDIDNPKINGQPEINTLKNMSNVSIYVGGVCINQKDNSINSRLNSYDSTSAATYARTMSDFNYFTTKLKEKINNKFIIPINGVNGYYIDKLSNDFSLNKNGLSPNIRILQSEDSSKTKNIPNNVYNTFKSNNSILGVYVENTKTMYWNIKKMTNGNYNTDGHTFNFPVHYNNYENTTSSQDISLTANTSQQLLYESSTNTNEQLSKTISTPYLMFHRQDTPILTLRKEIEGANFKQNKIYKFAITNTRQINTVTNPEKIVTITIPIGQTSNSINVTDISNGTHYLYEIDNSNNILNTTEKSFIVNQTSTLSTLGKSNVVPPSITTSDNINFSNINNYLKIVSSNASLTSKTSYTTLNGSKIWDDGNSKKRPTSVTVELYRNNIKIDTKIVSNPWSFSFENLLKYDKNNIEYDYTIKEIVPQNYKSKIDYSIVDNLMYAKITNTLLIGDLTIQKTIDSTNDILWFTHGNPIFMIKISGNDIENNYQEFTHTFEFTQDYVIKNSQNNKCTMSYTFKDIPISSNYKVEEVIVNRYYLDSIKSNDSNVSILNDNNTNKYYQKYANVNIKIKPEDTTVTFLNNKDNFYYFSNTAHIKNILK